MRAVLLILVACLFAGCAAPAAPAAPSDDAILDSPPAHALAGTVEPAELVAPVFDLVGAIAAGGPVYGAGEPSVWVDLDGTQYVAFPGCDRGFYLVGLPGQESCGHGLVYRNQGDGFERLNRDGDGRYTDDGPAANGDADVAVDAAGTVYTSNLGQGIQVHKFQAGAWSYIGDVVPDDEGADRQWMAAGDPGHLIVTWMRTSPSRDVAIAVTFDGGTTWLDNVHFGEGIGWLGSVQIAPDGKTAYIPYTQPTSGSTILVAGEHTCAMRVLRTTDGGVTWEDIDTGATITTGGGHWSCVHMTPSLDVTGDGTVALAYSADDSTMAGATTAQTLHVLTSTDGTTWGEPQRVPFRRPTPEGGSVASSVIMPWVVGGAGDRFAVTFLETYFTPDQDYAATTWDVVAAVFDGDEHVRTVIEEQVHAGAICTRGGACLLTGSDRAFLDFFEADIGPDGNLFVAYPHDLNPSKMIEIRVAVQDGGTPLAHKA